MNKNQAKALILPRLKPFPEQNTTLETAIQDFARDLALDIDMTVMQHMLTGIGIPPVYLNNEAQIAIREELAVERSPRQIFIIDSVSSTTRYETA